MLRSPSFWPVTASNAAASVSGTNTNENAPSTSTWATLPLGAPAVSSAWVTPAESSPPALAQVHPEPRLARLGRPHVAAAFTRRATTNALLDRLRAVGLRRDVGFDVERKRLAGLHRLEDFTVRRALGSAVLQARRRVNDGGLVDAGTLG